MKYNQPFNASSPNAPYVDANPTTGSRGSIPPANAIEYPQREIINAILAADLVPNNDDLTQLTQAIGLLGKIPYCIDQGSANSIVIDPIPVIFSYSIPLMYAVRIAQNNTGPTDVNCSGLGTVSLTRPSGVALSANDLSAGGIIIISFDGVKFQLLTVPQSLAYPGPDSLWHYGHDTSTTPNFVQVNVDDVGVAWSDGLPVAVRISNTCTGASNMSLNGFANVNITRTGSLVLQPGDMVIGCIALFMFDGTQAQLINPQTMTAAALAGVEDITGPDRPYWLSVNSMTPTAPPGTPNLGDTYLIPAVGATDIWTGLGGSLSQWNGTSWVHRSYPAGSVIGVEDSGKFYKNIGANIWQQVYLPTAGQLFFFAQL